MPISVKDIQEKEFSRQKRDGYMIEEVDDFLDEIADQLSVLIRENMALSEKVRALETERSAAPVAPLFAPESAPAPVAQQADPAYDEPSYFKNLELAMRDTLIGAQRIADDTVAEARKKAQELVSAAEEEAGVISARTRSEVEHAKAEARAELDSAKAEAANVRQSTAEYRAAFRRLVDGQMQLLKDVESALN